MLNENTDNNLRSSNNELNKSPITTLNEENMSDELIPFNYNIIESNNIINNSNIEPTTNNQLLFNQLDDDLSYSNDQLIPTIQLSEPNIKILESNIQLAEPKTDILESNIEFEEINFLKNDKQNGSSKLISNEIQPNSQDKNLDNNSNNNNSNNNNSKSNVQDNQNGNMSNTNKRPIEESVIENYEEQNNLSKRIKLTTKPTTKSSSLSIPFRSLIPSTTTIKSNTLSIPFKSLIPSTTTNSNALSIPFKSLIPPTTIKSNTLSIPFKSLVPSTAIKSNSLAIPTTSAANLSLFITPRIQQQTFIPTRPSINRQIESESNVNKLLKQRIEKLESELNSLKAHVKNLEVVQKHQECCLKMLEKQFVEQQLNNDQLKLYYRSTDLNSQMKDQFSKVEQKKFNLNTECNRVSNNLKPINKNTFSTPATRRINCVNGILSKNCTDYADKLIKNDQIGNNLKPIRLLDLKSLNYLSDINNQNSNTKLLDSNKLIESNKLILKNNLMNKSVVVNPYSLNKNTFSIGLEDANNLKKEFKIKLKRITSCPICFNPLDCKTHQCKLN